MTAFAIFFFRQNMRSVPDDLLDSAKLDGCGVFSRYWRVVMPLVKPALADIKKLLDPSEEGAAPLLGVDGLVFIGHGRSDAMAVKNAVRVAIGAVRSGMQERLRREFTHFTPVNAGVPKENA